MTFTAYGYTLAGLPEVLAAAGAPMVAPRRGLLEFSSLAGPVPSEPQSWLLEAASSVTIGWAGYGEFIVCTDSDRQLTVVRDGVDELEAGICCCQSVLPLALPLLGLEALHASAVFTPVGALLLAGPSGSGKTSLATTFVRLGFPLLADDACAFDDDGLLWPGPRLMNLRPGAITGPLPGEVVGGYNQKLAMVPAHWRGEPSEVGAIVLLEPKPQSGLEMRRLRPREAVPAVLAQVRASTVLTERRRSPQLRLAARLAGVPVAGLSYDQSQHSLGETADAILGWLNGISLPLPATGDLSSQTAAGGVL